MSRGKYIYLLTKYENLTASDVEIFIRSPHEFCHELKVCILVNTRDNNPEHQNQNAGPFSGVFVFDHFVFPFVLLRVDLEIFNPNVLDERSQLS